MNAFKVSSLIGLILLCLACFSPSLTHAQPDLYIVEFSAPASLIPGQVITDEIHLRIGNSGDQDAIGFSVGIYLSVDRTITPGDRLLDNGRTTVSGLDFNSDMLVMFPEELRVPVEIEDGPYYIGPLVDDLNQIEEADEANNHTVSRTEVSTEKPNLRASSFSGPTSAYLGQQVGNGIQLTIENDGQIDAGQFSVGIYLSPDVRIEPFDDLLVGGRKTIYSLQAGASVQVPFDPQVSIPTDSTLGSQYIGVLVDDLEQVNEKYESDNDDANTITIFGPDLAIFDFACERYSAGPGQAIGEQVNVTITNQGQADGVHPYNAGIYLSTDSTITTSDTLLVNGQLYFASLPAGYFVDAPFPASMSIPSGVTPGNYYIGVLVDSYNAEPEDDETNNQQSQPFVVTADTWTVMGYFDGDCDREAQALGNMGQMEQANQAGVPINLVALVDRHPNPGPQGGYTNVKVPFNGSDWSDTRWGPVIYDGNQNSFATSMYHLNPSQPELNVADDDTLISYVSHMMEVAPAQHYALVIFNHGSVGGVAQDDTSGDHSLDMSELRAALDALPYIDIMILDACLMQEVEVATEMVGDVDYVLASQAERSGSSKGSYTNLDKSLQWLVTHPNATPSQFVQKLFVEDKHDIELAGQQGGVSVLDLDEIPKLNQLVDVFTTTAIQTATISERIELQNERSGVETFSPWKSYLDLKEYMTAVTGNSSINSQLRNAAQHIADQVDQVVVHKKGPGNGVSIFFPDGSNKVPSWYNGTKYTFLNTFDPNGTHWHGFLLSLPPFTAVLNVIDVDSPDLIVESLLIEADPMQPRVIETAIDHTADVDFFKLIAPSGQVLYVDLYGDPANGGLLPLLTVYAQDQETILTQVPPNEYGVASVEGLELPGEGEYYLAVTSVGHDNPLIPGDGISHGHYSLSVVFGNGEALLPELSINEPYLFFGEVPIGVWGMATVQLGNRGGTSLDVTELRLPDDSPFRAPAEAILLPITLTPGESFNLSIGVSPDQIGPRVDPMYIISTDPNSPEIEVILEVVGVDPCEGDFEPDGDVDDNDLAKFALHFGTTNCGNGAPCEGDFDVDEDTDGMDLSVFAADFGRTDCL